MTAPLSRQIGIISRFAEPVDAPAVVALQRRGRSSAAAASVNPSFASRVAQPLPVRGAYPMPSSSIVSGGQAALCEQPPRRRARPASASCSRNHAAATSCAFSSASRSRWRLASSFDVLRLRHRQADPRRELPHRFRET